MSSYANFQVNRNKSKNEVNIFKKGKNNRKTSKSDRLMESISIWASFYIANPTIFVREYFGIKLKMFQQVILYAMMHFSYTCYFAARGQGKTFLTAIFCCTICTLKPSTKVIIASGVKSQAREVIEKIDELRKEHPNLAREISILKTGSNDALVEFHNGSWIKIVASNDNARSKRCTLLIVDEFRMVDINVINTVLRKFQTATRHPKYLDKPEYEHLLQNEDELEDNKQIYLSSAFYKSSHAWDRFNDYFDAMINGRSYFLCGLPYYISVQEGLLKKKQVQEEMMEKSFDETSFNIEMRCMFHGISDKAFFSFEDLQKNRKLNKVYYPKDVSELINDKTASIPKKEIGEIRVVSADIALSAGSQNDASAFTVARLIPTKEGYDRQIVYLEAIEGGHTLTQAIRIRQLFYDFSCDYIVLDTQNAGQSIYDILTESQMDNERGVEYEPLSCMNDDKLAERCVYSNAPKIIYSIKANAGLNSDIAVRFKDDLKRKKIKLPVPENEAKDVLKGFKGYMDLPIELRTKFLLPYIHTDLMINEVLNLESEFNHLGQVRLKEVSGMRKDRYTSISYLNYFASELEVKNRKKKSSPYDPSQLFLFSKGRKYN